MRLAKDFFQVDRVGFFVIDKERGSMVLKVPTLPNTNPNPDPNNMVLKVLTQYLLSTSSVLAQY